METVVKNKTLQRILALVLVASAVSACSLDLDFCGFIRSTDPAERRFDQSMEWNETNPFQNLNTDTEDYSILVAADIHIGGVQNLNKFLTETQKPEILAFVLDGDMVTGKREDFVKLRNELSDPNLKPYFLLIGNHELYFDGWKTFYEFFGTSVYYFTVQTPTEQDIYICLDSGGGTLGEKQLKWLKEKLDSERNKYRNCVVFTHVNFYRNRHTGSTNPLVTELYVLMDVFAKHNVNMVITGHDHVRNINILGNTHYVSIDALKDNTPNASFLELNVSNEKINYVFRELNE
jgi:3',5'-cyclic AMP phosphodiesterase CpdA